MIGIPTVTQYGSSYGKFGGIRLEDYQNPLTDPIKLNNSDARDVNSFTNFDRTIKDFILARLGHPTVRVELTDFQIKTCIEEAISKLEYHAPLWMNQYAVFDTSAGINVYQLPQAVINGLSDVWYRRNLFNIGATPGSLGYDFAIMFFTNTGLFNNYNVGEYLLMQMYLKQVGKVLGQGSSWNIVNGKYLQVFPVPDGSTPIILEFRAFDYETVLPAYKNWIQRYSLCVAKEILGRVRSKFQTLPGPGGGSRLDGESLLAEAKEEKQMLLEELTTEIENPPLFDIF
jgi:hypothetical protein